MAICETCEREYLDSYQDCPFCAREAARRAAEADAASRPQPVDEAVARRGSWALPTALIAGLASAAGIVVYIAIQAVFVGQAVEMTDVADRKVCFASQANVERMGMVYREENGEQAPDLDALLDGYVQAPLTCPSGGSYAWDPDTGRLSCSIHGLRLLER